MEESEKSHLILQEKYVLGIKIIDEQHSYFIELLNEVYDTIHQRGSGEKIGHVVDKVIGYAGFHFATEEKYFDEFNYDGRVEHESQHRDISVHLMELKNRLAEDEVAVAGELADLMEDWLTAHIAIYDRKYVECFHQHGLT